MKKIIFLGLFSILGLGMFLFGYTYVSPESRVDITVDRQKAFDTAVKYLADNGVDISDHKMAIKFSSDNHVLAYLQENATKEEMLKNAKDGHAYFWYFRAFKPLQKEEVEVRIDAVSGIPYAHKFNTDVTIYEPETLIAPEWFTRVLDNRNFLGTFFTHVALLLVFFLLFAALIVCIAKYKVSQLNWKFALGLGCAVSLFALASSLNSFSIQIMDYTTQLSYLVFIAEASLVILLTALLYGIFTFFSGAAGEALTRASFPRSAYRIREIFSRAFFRDRTIASSTIAGYALVFICLGLEVAIYFIGVRYLHVHAGVSVDMLSSVSPFLYSITESMKAAVSEELVFRLFAISLFKKILKSTFSQYSYRR